MIEFYLNSKKQSVSQDQDDITLLEYIRIVKNQTSTKEGCASGDCGACTIMEGQWIDGKWSYKTINSCITFVSQCHSKNIITIDALKNQKDLHPAQQAMIDFHGSQCGYCTPGFIMSMASLFESAVDIKKLSDGEIKESLAGNLCRCTGYRPIIDATKHMQDYKWQKDIQIWSPEKFENHTKEDFDKNISIDNKNTNSNIQSFICHNESELQQLLLKYPTASIINGATDIALEKTQQYKCFEKTITINQIDSLKIIEDNEQDNFIKIGSAVSFTQMQETIQQYFPDFYSLLKRIGSMQIRNQGTLGGNIANGSPIADTPAVLIALDAKIELKMLDESRVIALEDFYIDYKKTVLKQGEYIASITIPKLQSNQYLKVFKISKRLEDDISTVLSALMISVEEDKIKTVRCAFGGMAATIKRAKKFESKLLGMPFSLESFEQASNAVMSDFNPMTDVRASDQYRLLIAKNLIIKSGIELCESSQQFTRIEQIHSIDDVNNNKELGYHA